MAKKTSKTILIADNNDFFRMKLCEILIQDGHRTRVASEGREVINQIENSLSEIDFLVLDHRISPTDSFWILDWLQNSDHKDSFPVLVISADELSEVVVEQLKEYGATGVMIKTNSPEQIAYQITQILFKPIYSRAAPRCSVSFPAVFEYGKRIENGRVLNMSENGLFWYSRIRHKPGTEIHVRFTLPESKKEMYIKGVTMRYRRMGELNNLFSEIGLQFQDLSEEDDLRIKKFLSEQIDHIYPRD